MPDHHRVLAAADAFWRPSNQMGVANTDIAKQLAIDRLGARLWRLAPGQASTRHRHAEQAELYVLLEGTGRMRVGDDLLTLEPHSTVFAEVANTLEMTEEQLRFLYPDGPKALPPELAPD
jgi:uncharacterized cupin superfamily protein